MKYIIRRTSEWDSTIPPCKEAKKESITTYSWCTCSTLEKAKKHDWFWREGTFDHIKIKGKSGVRHSRKEDVWIIELENIEKLNQFISKYGDIVMQEYESPDILYCIEIYDGYRE